MPNLPLFHWSSQLFNLRAPSSTHVPVLLLNQSIISRAYASRVTWSHLVFDGKKEVFSKVTTNESFFGAD